MKQDKFKKGNIVRHTKYDGIYTIIGKSHREGKWDVTGNGTWYVEEYDENELELVSTY